MPISIIAPAAALPIQSHHAATDDEMDVDDYEQGQDGGDALDKHASRTIFTPGEILTQEPHWMRGHGTFTTTNSTSDNNIDDVDGPCIRSTLAGTLQKTNKLLSIVPLRARYTPEIGDLVIGRIIEVQSKRWKVDVCAAVSAVLLLSSINLPGGTLRKRTSVDELNMRTFFEEGELLVAEVQSLHQDGSASLHTRSLKYGKLRNGFFMVVAGTGGGGGVVRAKRQIFSIVTHGRGGLVDVVLGVNGYIMIQQATKEDAAKKEFVVTRSEESVAVNMYSSQNDYISADTRTEIARVAWCIRAIADNAVKVEEDMVRRAYDASVELAEAEMQTGDVTGFGDEDRARLVVDMALGHAG